MKERIKYKWGDISAEKHVIESGTTVAHVLHGIEERAILAIVVQNPRLGPGFHTLVRGPWWQPTRSRANGIPTLEEAKAWCENTVAIESKSWLGKMWRGNGN